jgi:cyanophycin synthetase
VLIFADALTRTWKQILHFVPEGAGPGPRVSAASATPSAVRATNGAGAGVDVPAAAPLPFDTTAFEGDLLVRDERGVRLAREQDD